MKIVGIIAEFNPFHNGHKYLIEQARLQSNADYVVVVMSGNYVQRGEPAVMSKHDRARIAIDNGCDLIIELPYIYSCGSAKYFAHGAISLLNELGCINSLAFGVEEDNLEFLQIIAEVLHEEPDYFKERLNHYGKNGFSFPVAREHALYDYFLFKEVSFDENEFNEIMASPNCILGIEYLCALRKFNSAITPLPIKRRGANYHSEFLHEEFSSATAIRSALENPDLFTSVKLAVPENCHRFLTEEYQKSYPVKADDFSHFLAYCLENNGHYEKYFDCSLNFANRIENLKDSYTGYSSFCEELTTKNTTRTSVNRSILHILLGIHSSFVNDICKNGYHSYVRVLAFQKKHSELLSKIKYNCSLPLITKMADAENYLDERGYKLLNSNHKADNLYRLAKQCKYKRLFPDEYRTMMFTGE